MVLASELLTTLPTLRVLFMSGYSDTTLSDQSLLGVNASFIEKPFSPASLAAAVRLALS
jgi:FixJ family two-component response regulator